MRTIITPPLVLLCACLTCFVFGCSDDVNAWTWRSLIPGPKETGHDDKLSALADKYDRGYHAIFTPATGLNTEVVVGLDRTEDRDRIKSFLHGSEWEIEKSAGKPVREVIESWGQTAGAYGGVGVAADAFRYGVLRDRSFPGAEVDRARGHVLRGLEGMIRVIEITGVPGVIARGIMSKGFPGSESVQTILVPLFDKDGKPLPAEKDNGTWRADNSGKYPGYIWVDSCSRDQYMGWMVGLAGAWEVIRADESFPSKVKDALRTHARSLANELSKIRSDGLDLQIPDADGRTTYHGYLHEKYMDRTFLGLPRNGAHAAMAIGALAALAYVADDPGVDAYLYEELLGKRQLATVVRDYVQVVDMGAYSNFSTYNMVFAGAWLSFRYLKPEAEEARKALEVGLDQGLYNPEGKKRQPVEHKHSFFDFTYVAGMAGGSVWSRPERKPDEAAIQRGLETLGEFPEPPYWEIRRDNCDDAEIAAKVCTGIDGTTLHLLGDVGWNQEQVAREQVPMRIRPPSNYHWRDNPYKVNGGGDGTRLLSGVDFRFAYWIGRWTQRR